MASVWKGSLGFGMVNIPVKLTTTSEDKRQDLLHQYHTCGTQIKMPKWCPKCETFLEPGEIIKGFPVDKEHFIPLTSEEMELLPLNSIKNIQIEHFMKGELDPIWFQKAYFVSPQDEAGVKAFVLFARAMETENVFGLAKITVRSREYLCMVKPYKDILLLQTIHWAEEVRANDFSPSATISDREMEMATALIKAMTSEVELDSYRDEYREALMKIVQTKLLGGTVELPKPSEKHELDLADALLASLSAVSG